MTRKMSNLSYRRQWLSSSLHQLAAGGLLVMSLLEPCAASLVRLDLQGVITQPQSFVPGAAPGTAWSMSVTFDESAVANVRQIPGYNSTYSVLLMSGLYRLGGSTSSLDHFWITIFDNSVGGGDELNFTGNFGGQDQLTVTLNDPSGRSLTGLGLPDFRSISLADIETRFVRFNEASPLVSGLVGGSYRQGSVDSLTATSIPEPSSLALVATGIALISVFPMRRRFITSRANNALVF